VEIVTRDKSELDLMDQQAVHNFFAGEQVDQVYLAAARVGGIHANKTYPFDFIYQNLTIQNNVIHSAYVSGVPQLLFLGSSCIYPKLAEQPMQESSLLCGKLEPTNEPYAIAKIAGIKLCESLNRQFNRDFRCVMPTNLYGINDYFHSENSHVIPALINRFHQAKVNDAAQVLVWGTGNARREFLFVDDLADACVFVMGLDQSTLSRETDPGLSHLNIGTGIDVTIRELAQNIAEVVGFAGVLEFDSSRPDGSPRKLLDVRRMKKLGWQAKTELKTGLETTYRWYCEHIAEVRT
ncbi:MAG: GDP-L-fucose synthase, partial [Arenicellales bacterium]